MDIHPLTNKAECSSDALIHRVACCTATALMLVGASAQTVSSSDYFVETVVSGLAFPSSMAFVGPSTFLIAEKNIGRVRVVQNGIVTGIALDLPVANQSEQGLLGICTHPSFDSNGLVYLFYSRAASDGGAWIEDRVDRYVWNGSTLTFDASIFSVPFDASQTNTPYHHGGVIRIGPDQKLYIQFGDLDRGAIGLNKIEQNTGSGVSGAGCIYRVNLDGSIPSDNPFTFHSDDRIKKAWVYGFRNGFGMAFDPIGGYLWFTENGPEVYDELNVAVPGMNSGWRKIMGPDSRDATYGGNNNTAYNASDLTMLTNAAYADPVLSWLSPIAPTCLAFLTSDKFGPAERDKLIMGDVNTGQIYLFEPNGARNGLVLTGGAADLVADTAAEANVFSFGSGWGISTDMQLGPDGYLYVVSFTQGRVLRIRPATEVSIPTALSLFRGSIISGGLTDIQTSDDQRLILRPGVVFSNSEQPIQLIGTSVSPFQTLTQLKVSVESQVSAANIQQRLYLYDYVTQSFEEVALGLATLSDSTLEATLNSNINRFVESGTRAVQAKVGYRSLSAVFVYPWMSRVDRIAWTLTR
jgi:glucose/arabinose dehydrogenase